MPFIDAQSGRSAYPIIVAGKTVSVLATGEQWVIDPVGELANIIDAGGLFAYARKSGRIKSA